MLPGPGSLLQGGEVWWLRNCETSLLVCSATKRDEAHDRTYFSLSEYLYSGLLAVIPLPANFEMSFTPFNSRVFNNADNGLFVHD